MRIFPVITLLAIASAGRAAEPAWQKHSVALGESVRGIDTADLDGDGAPDILATGVTKVFAILNPLHNSTPTVIADCQDGILLYGAAIDANGDGRLDFAIARETNPWITFRALPASSAPGAKPTPPVGPDFGLAWLENLGHMRTTLPLHSIATDFDGIHGLRIVDLNGDGRPDIVANCIKGELKDSLVWFENTGRGFTRHFIARNTTDERPHYMDAADLNGDGRLDVLVGCSGGGTVTWWENPASPERPWLKHVISATEKGATNVCVADLDGDGILDVVVSNGHGTGLAWFAGPRWEKHVVDSAIIDAHALAIGDFNGDGHLDIATASFSQKTVKWYANNGKGNFKTHVIDDASGQEAYDLKIADLNRDGRPDLVLAGRATNNAAWYLNLPASISTSP